MYAYIKNEKILLTSDQLIEKQKEQILGEVTETKEIEVPKLDENGVQIVDENGKPETETQTVEVKTQVSIQEFIPGLAYNEVIEYAEEGRVTYEGGKIIPYEASEEKAAEDKKAEEEKAAEDKKAEEEAAAEAKKRKEARPQAIIEELGKLKAEKDGLALVGGDTAETDARIAALQEEYAEITA